MAITKAIIPVAGWGTRRLPITKAIEKCMLPVGNRPIVDYVVQDCIKGGITDIYFVVSSGSSQIQAYYGDNLELNQYLRANGKDDYLAEVTPIKGVKFHYVTQDASDKYGTAIPIALTAHLLGGDESVVVLMGDDFIYNADGSSETARLIAATPDGGSSMLGVNVPPDQVSRYGVIDMDMNNKFVQIVEKPKPHEAPSTLINVSKYILNSQIIKHIVDYTKVDLGDKEYYITEPINHYVHSGGTVTVVPAEGQYLDGGSVEGWLHANNVVVGGV